MAFKNPSSSNHKKNTATSSHQWPWAPQIVSDSCLRLDIDCLHCAGYLRYLSRYLSQVSGCFSDQIPSGKLKICFWKCPIYSWFSHWKRWFSIVMLAYQRVEQISTTSQEDERKGKKSSGTKKVSIILDVALCIGMLICPWPILANLAFPPIQSESRPVSQNKPLIHSWQGAIETSKVLGSAPRL